MFSEGALRSSCSSGRAAWAADRLVPFVLPSKLMIVPIFALFGADLVLPMMESKKTFLLGMVGSDVDVENAVGSLMEVVVGKDEVDFSASSSFGLSVRTSG